MGIVDDLTDLLKKHDPPAPTALIITDKDFDKLLHELIQCAYDGVSHQSNRIDTYFRFPVTVETIPVFPFSASKYAPTKLNPWPWQNLKKKGT